MRGTFQAVIVDKVMTRKWDDLCYLGLKVTLDPLLEAGPLLPAPLLPQLTLDTGPLDLN